jgi:hypothetical protein
VKPAKRTRRFVLVDDYGMWTRDSTGALNVYKFHFEATGKRRSGERVVAYDCIPVEPKPRRVKK